MADDTSTTTEPDEAATANPGDTPDEELGEAGLRALQREREQRRSLEQQLRELQPLAAKARELEEAQKTEAQRLQERAAAAERERDEVRVEMARLRMAARYGIAEDDLDLLGTGTDEEIESRAKRLSERFAAPPAAASATRPTESMRSLTSGSTGEEPSSDGNEWFRKFAAGARH